MNKRIPFRKKIAVVKTEHVHAFVNSLNKTVPSRQERDSWKNLSSVFSVRSTLSMNSR